MLAHYKVTELAGFCGAVITVRSESAYIDTASNIFNLNMTNRTVIDKKIIGLAVSLNRGRRPRTEIDAPFHERAAVEPTRVCALKF